jgi:hypothetical protein
MGLDISLYKVVPLGKRKSKEINDYYVLKDFPELSIFENLAFEKTNKYHDLDVDLMNKGYSMETLEYLGTSYGRTTTFNFKDKNHELYDADKWLYGIWSESYFLSKKELYESEYFKIFKEKYYDILIKNGWKENYRFYAYGNNTNYFNLVPAQSFIKKKIRVFIKNPKSLKRIDKCIAYEEVGYQRKGANKLFHDNNIWDHPCITDLKTLKEHHEKYFSPITVRSVLFEKTFESKDINPLEFKHNIVDKFVEGEMFVIYH